jgi:hypothetical protein
MLWNAVAKHCLLWCRKWPSMRQHAGGVQGFGQEKMQCLKRATDGECCMCREMLEHKVEMLHTENKSLLAQLRSATENSANAASDSEMTNLYILGLEAQEEGPPVKQLSAELKVQRYKCQELEKQVGQLSAFFEQSSRQLREAVRDILGWRCGTFSLHRGSRITFLMCMRPAALLMSV